MCKLPISYRLDFGIFHYESGELVGLAELKCRNYNFGDFSTFSISAGKFNSGNIDLIFPKFRIFILPPFSIST